MWSIVQAQQLIDASQVDIAEEFTQSSEFFDSGIFVDTVLGETVTHPVITSTSGSTIKIKGKPTKPSKQTTDPRVFSVIMNEDYLSKDKTYYNGIPTNIAIAKLNALFAAKIKGLGHQRLTGIFNPNLPASSLEVSLASMVEDRFNFDCNGQTDELYSIYLIDRRIDEGFNFITNSTSLLEADDITAKSIGNANDGFLETFHARCSLNLGMRSGSVYSVMRISGIDADGTNASTMIKRLKEAINQSKGSKSDMLLVMNGTCRDLLGNSLVTNTLLDSNGNVRTDIMAYNSIRISIEEYIADEAV